jgi:uncharacterized protein YjeT (DUF2065 family)
VGLGEALFGALALMLVLEGLMPLINPGGWRQVFSRVLQMSDGQIRFIGLLSVLAGLMLLWIWH